MENSIGKLLCIETSNAGAYKSASPAVLGWRQDIGGLFENGVHKLDLAVWFGGPIKYVKGEAGSLYETWHEDYVISILKFENDAVGVLKWGPFLGARGDTRTILDGTHGTIVANMDDNYIDFKKIGEKSWKRIAPKKRDPYLEQMTHFIDCLRTRKEPTVTGVDGKRAIELAYAIYLAAKEHRKVDLPLQKTPTLPYYE